MTSKTIHNIFSAEKIVRQNNLPKQIIIADYREKNSLLPSLLVRENFEIEFKELKIGDFVIKDVIIERKTVSDFISSMINKRLVKQLEEIGQYDKKLLLIEGIEEQELYNDHAVGGVSANAIRGFLLSILLKYRVPIIFTKNAEDTAKFFSVLARKKSKPMSLYHRKKALLPKEQIQFILEGFPGIGPTISDKLLKKFGSLREIIFASQSELGEVLGKKANSFHELIGMEF